MARPQPEGLAITPIGNFEHLRVGSLTSNPAVGCIELFRPARSNAFNEKMLCDELPLAIKMLSAAPAVRVVLLTGAGRNFSAGIDITYLASGFLAVTPDACPGEVRESMRDNIMRMQDGVSCLERCRHPVIAAVQGACVGLGVDIITACDMRICSEDAKFCVKEVDLALAADMGTLQRLPHIVGHGAAMELSLTADTIGAARAFQLGLVSSVVPPASLQAAATALAAKLAAKPALGMRATKKVLLHARDHGGVDTNLEYIATYNSAVLLNHDLINMVSSTAKPKAKTASKL